MERPLLFCKMTDIIGEALRYLGIKSDPGDELRGRLEALAGELRERVRPRHVLRVLDIRREGETLALGESVILPGTLAADMLRDCERAALLVCTLGTSFDAWMRTAQARDMAGAVLLDALGSAWVEAGCDEAEEELAAKLPGMYLTDRFSPGYGDLPLSVQPEILEATDAARRLGVQVTASCLINPQKTVTAVIGIAGMPQPARVRGCARCPIRGECAYRKEGKTCEA